MEDTNGEINNLDVHLNFSVGFFFPPKCLFHTKVSALIHRLEEPRSAPAASISKEGWLHLKVCEIFQAAEGG